MKSCALALMCAALLAPALPASAAEVYPIVFPVVGPHHFTDTYDSPRAGGRLHEATDIMAAKMTTVVAVADGTVGWVSSTCCGLQLIHDDGYQSWYIHLNNDTPGTDDGNAWGIAPGIERGVHVTAGQLIGWVGDSGNAEHTAPHLHFQLHYPDGSRFNPYESLRAARHLDPVAADEILFYRADGLYRYYDIKPDAKLGAPIRGGTDYASNWSAITAVDLDGDGGDEIFFYRDDGLYSYYDIRSNGRIGAPIKGGIDYTAGWTAITAIDLNGDGQDEMFFYRDDGLYSYYDIRSNGRIGAPIKGGTDYTAGWTAITAIDLDGDGQDEMFFYRDDGLYSYYDIRPDGRLGSPISGGTDYTAGWSAITAIDLNGDGKDEMLFYRDDGTFSYHSFAAQGLLGHTILSGSGYTAGWSSISSINLDG